MSFQKLFLGPVRGFRSCANIVHSLFLVSFENGFHFLVTLDNF